MEKTALHPKGFGHIQAGKKFPKAQLPSLAALFMGTLGMDNSAVLAAAHIFFRKKAQAAARQPARKLAGLLSLHGESIKSGLAHSLASNALSAAEVARHMGWKSRAMVNKAKLGGQILGFSIPGHQGDLFPSWQFAQVGVKPWVPKLLKQTGNGWAAVLFLTKKRVSLENTSYLDRLTEDEIEIVPELLARAARLGDMDAGAVGTREAKKPSLTVALAAAAAREQQEADA